MRKGDSRGLASATSLDRIVEALAIVAGVILVALSAMTVVSILGRALFSTSVKGDFELVEKGVGLAIFLGLPYVQARRKHIVVDFFTVVLSPRLTACLDALASLVFGIVLAILAWRLGHGGLDYYASWETTMLLALPRWWDFLVIVPTVLIAAIMSVRAAALDLRRMAS